MERTWRIGEVAERTGLTRRTLRHYDDLGLLVPSARSWGEYRLYDETDLLRLLQIQNLKALGLPLRRIAEALADPELDATVTLRSHLEHLEARISAEQRLADRLRSLAESPVRSWEDVLDTIAWAQQLAHPDPTVRLRTVLQGAGPTAETLDALATETDPAVQDVLIWALAQRPDAAQAAIARLGTAGPDLRRLLAWVLRKVRDPAGVPTLIGLLADPDPQVAVNSVRALGALADPAAAPALVALLGSTRIPEADLLDAICAIGAPALDPLVAASALPSPETRAGAVEAIGRLGADLHLEFARLGPLLTPRLADPDPAVRQATLLALSEFGAPARPWIEQALADPRLAAVARRLLDLHPT